MNEAISKIGVVPVIKLSHPKRDAAPLAKQLADKFGFEKVAITLGESKSAFDNDWSAMLYDGTDYCFSKLYHLHIIDRVGVGPEALY